MVNGLFARLLAMMPADFAQEYGAAMATTLRERALEARARGVARYWRFCARELTGLVGAVVMERRAARVAAAYDRIQREGPGMLEQWKRELRHAARRLVRTPGFAAAALLTLALAIAANTAIFTLVNRVVLAPLPYPASERLMWIDHAAPGLGMPSNLGVSSGFYREYGKLPSVEAIAMYLTDGEATLTGDGDAERLHFVSATPSLGGLLGARPALGRWLSEADGVPGASPVMVLTHGLWVRRFGGDPRVIGTLVQIDGNAHEVIGVMPPEFRIPEAEADFVRAYAYDPATARVGGLGRKGIARVRAGVSADMLREQQNAVIADMPTRFPEDELAHAVANDAQMSSLTQPLKTQMLGDVGTTLWVLLGAVGIVLLIACANLANLFLVRVDARQREVAVRRALGAARRHVAGYYLSEALLVALLSGALGLGIAAIAVDYLVATAPVELPRLHEVRIDSASIGCALLLSIVAGLLFGTMPLLRRAVQPSALLQEGGRGNTAGVARMRSRQVLMAAQVALALMLLVSAGLMLQSFQRMRSIDPGFRDDQRLTFQIGLAFADYPSADAAAAFNEQLTERLRALPGVESVGVTTTLPLGGDGERDVFEVRGREIQPGQMNEVALIRRVNTDYFQTFAIPLQGGAAFTVDDMAGRTRNVMINEAFAARYFPGQDPVGQQLRNYGRTDEGWYTVIGTTANTVTHDLREAAPAAQIYLPLRDPQGDTLTSFNSTHNVSYVLRTSTDPVSLLGAVQRTLAELDPNVALNRPETMTAIVARAGAGMAFTTILMLVAASVALLLGLIGVYAVIAYGVAQRTGEIGVRMALGARPQDVTAMIVRQSGGVIVVGIAIGLVGAVVTARSLEALLFGVAWNDGLTYAAVAVGLLVVALIGCWVPAERAARISPLEALR